MKAFFMLALIAYVSSAASAPTGRVFVSNERSNTVSVISGGTLRVEATIAVGLEPEGVAISPDGKGVIVTSESTNMLHIIAVPEHKVVANILVGARPSAAVFTRDGKIAYATSEIGGEVKTSGHGGP